MTNYGVGVENLVELSQLEEKDLFVIFLLQVPVLCHAWSEISPLTGRYVQSCCIVVKVIWPPSHLVHNEFRLEELR